MPTFRRGSTFLLFLVVFLLGCRTEKTTTYEVQQSATFGKAAVVTAHPLASEVGLNILRAGGNAVDAVVAVQFALAVVYPRAGNIGGGGFLVYRDKTGATDALDYREKAPAAAGRDMYLQENGDPIDGLSTKGHLAAGVPGTVAGLVAAHKKYGQLDWSTLVQPAINLATKGYTISTTEAERLTEFQEAFAPFNKPEDCPLIRENWKMGDLLVQKDLAATLMLIRDEGQAGFYSGKTAQLVVAEMQEGNGIITLEDLANYEATWRPAITADYKNYHLISMPPPSSGGVALSQMLGMIEDYPIADYGFHSTAATHLMVEAERRAYADRSEYLGDSDFYPVPLDSLLDKTYLDNRMADFSADSAGVSGSLSAGDFGNKESFETTHTSIIDEQGNAVSLTTTLNSNFGCKVMVDGGGFLLNNEMDDFSVKPGTPNIYGLIGAEANAIAPGKRMLSSMTPTIVEKDGQLFMVLGAPGGSTIITAVFQVFTNVAEFGMTLDSAVWAPRFHHQWLPDQIWVEPTALSAGVREELTAMGHHFRDVKRMAVIKAIQRLEDGSLQAVGDKRNPDDDVSGY